MTIIVANNTEILLPQLRIGAINKTEVLAYSVLAQIIKKEAVEV